MRDICFWERCYDKKIKEGSAYISVRDLEEINYRLMKELGEQNTE